MRGYQVCIELARTPRGPVKVVRKNKPRSGGATVAEFSNREGLGLRAAEDYIQQHGLNLVGIR